MMLSTSVTHVLQSRWPVSPWLVASLFVVAAILSLVPLIRERLPVQKLWILGVIRVTAIGVLFLMFGGWEITNHETDLPDIVLAVDTTRSMSLPLGDSASEIETSRIEAVKQLIGADSDFIRSLERNYAVRTYEVGDTVRRINDRASEVVKLRAQKTESRLGDNLMEILDRQQGRSTAATVLLSDGIVTTGASLSMAGNAYASRGVPLWCVGFGSDTKPLDVGIEEIVVDRRAFLGDKVIARVVITCQQPPQNRVLLELSELDNRRILDSKSIAVTSSRSVVELSFPADRSGEWNLQVSAKPVKGEIALDNNAKRFQVSVRDESIGVLLIAQKPSYEFRFMKHLLERSKGQGGDRQLVDLISVLQDGDPRYADQDRSARTLPPLRRSELEKLDVIVMCDADTDQLGAFFLDQIAELVRERGLGLIFIVGPENSPLPGDSPLKDWLPVSIGQPLEIHDGVALRRTPMGVANRAMEISIPWDDLPLLQWVVNVKNVADGAQVLLQGSSPALDRPVPIVVSQFAGAGQVWLHLTDESFRWRTASDGDNVFQQYWLRVIRQLARRKVSEVPRRPQFFIAGERFEEGDSVEVGLRLGSGMPRQEVRIAITRVDGETVERRLTASIDRADELIGLLDDFPEGSYTISLQSPLVEPMPSPVTFSIETKSTELRDAAADLLGMQNASQANGGDLISPKEIKSLMKRLPKGRRIKLRQLPSTPLWNSSWVAAIIVGLLSCDWLLRRRWGLP